MSRKAVSTVLSGALALGSFLCLGMGMDMGTAWAAQGSHDCCPRQAPQELDTNCCLLLPGAVSAPVTVADSIQTFIALPVGFVVSDVSAERRSAPAHGPPGAASPGFLPSSSPRAPPVA